MSSLRRKWDWKPFQSCFYFSICFSRLWHWRWDWCGLEINFNCIWVTSNFWGGSESFFSFDFWVTRRKTQHSQTPKTWTQSNGNYRSWTNWWYQGGGLAHHSKTDLDFFFKYFSASQTTYFSGVGSFQFPHDSTHCSSLTFCIIWVQNIKIWRHIWLHLCLNQFLTGVKGVEEIIDEPMTEKEEEHFHQLEVLSAKNEICTRFITCLPLILNFSMTLTYQNDPETAN